MTEAKVEMKVSSKSMEAAMVARLFKDAIESDDPIVGHFVWIRDDGQKLDLGRPVVHPSFPNKDSAMRRLETRIGQWVSGDKPGLDKNAIARLEIAGAAPFDFSMESFEKAALGDDGTLVIAVGHTKGVGREPMEAGRVARLKLYAKGGEPVGRRQALLPIREIIQIQKRERAAQAQRLEKQEKQMDDGVDIGRQLAQEEERQWEDVSREPVSREQVAREQVQPQGAERSVDRAKMMMDMAIGAVGRNMGPALKSKPLPYAEARPQTPKGPARLALGDDFEAAFERGDEEEEDGAPAAPMPAKAPQPLARVEQPAASVPIAAPAPPAPAVEAPAARQPLAPPVAAPAAEPPAAQEFVRIAPGSQVRAEAPSAPIEPMFLRAVFPALPEGCDEIHLTIERDMLFGVLEALEDHGALEMRLASRGANLLSLGLCVPCGKLPLLSEFIAAFSKGGVMIKRGVAKLPE